MKKEQIIIISAEDLEQCAYRAAMLAIKNSKEENTNLSPARESLMNVEEAATFLHLKESTIYTKVNKRELPSMKRGKRLYFSKQDLIEYVKKGKMKTNEEIYSEARGYLRNKNTKINNYE